jgi:hypothetical protein
MKLEIFLYSKITFMNANTNINGGTGLSKAGLIKKKIGYHLSAG